MKSRVCSIMFISEDSPTSTIFAIKNCRRQRKAHHYQVSALAYLYPTQALTAKAVRTYLEGLKFYPDDLGLRWTLAVSSARNLQWGPALRQAVKVIDKDPKNVQGLAVKAICLHRAGRRTLAIFFCDELLAIDPGDEELNMLIVSYARVRNKADDAVVAFDRWTQLRPRSAVALVWRAEFESDQGRPEDALKHFEQAVALNPSYGTAQYKIGKLYYNKQNWAAACKAFLLCEKLGSNHSSGVAKLCDCLLRAKQYKEAVRVCTMAMEMFKRQHIPDGGGAGRSRFYCVARIVSVSRKPGEAWHCVFLFRGHRESFNRCARCAAGAPRQCAGSGFRSEDRLQNRKLCGRNREFD